VKVISLLLCAVVLASSYPKSTRINLKEVETQIDSIVTATDGKFGIAFKDLQTGKTIYRNATGSFHAASTMKTPVMIEVFNQARHKKFSLDDSIQIVNNFSSLIDGSPYSLDISSDSDDSLYALLGKKESIRTLVYTMITVSSNLATNLLLQKIDARNVQRTMRGMGLKDIQILRGVEDSKAFDAGKNNTTTAKDLSIVYEKLARKKLVSRKACDEMLDVLLHQKFNEMIPGMLPKKVKVAHKTGSIEGVQHDSGIIYLPDGRKYVLVVLSKDLKDAKKGIEAIARISKIIYDHEIQ
jgi:beta-lactamase class A